MRRSTIFEFLNSQPIINGEKVRLRPRKIEDAPDEYIWRKDAELCKLDAALPIEFTYSDFLERYSVELEYPGLIFTLAIETNQGKHIGNCSLFNFDFLEGNAEIGLMLGDKSFWDQGYGTDVMKSFVRYIFQSSSLSTILLRTLDFNKRAQACFAKSGFTPCGTMVKEDYRFMLMEIRRPVMVGPDQ